MKLRQWFFNISRAFIVLSFVVGTGSAGANLALSRGVGKTLGPMATRALSNLLKVSPARLSTMSPKQRGKLLESRVDILRREGKQELAADANDLFLKITQGHSVEERATLLLARMAKEKISVRNLLNKNSPSPQKAGIEGGAMSVLRGRVQNGELTSSAVEEFSTTVQSANKALGFNILGNTARECLENFSPALVGNFMNLVSSLKTPRAVISVQSAFNAMVAKSEKLFGDNIVSAKDRICALSGRGGICQALAPRMCAF